MLTHGDGDDALIQLRYVTGGFVGEGGVAWRCVAWAGPPPSEAHGEAGRSHGDGAHGHGAGAAGRARGEREGLGFRDGTGRQGQRQGQGWRWSGAPFGPKGWQRPGLWGAAAPPPLRSSPPGLLTETIS